MADLGKLPLNAELEFNFKTGKIELSQVKQALAQAEAEIQKESTKLSKAGQAVFPFAKKASYPPGSKVSAMSAMAQQNMITDPTYKSPLEHVKPEYKGGVVPDWKKLLLFPAQQQAHYALKTLQPFEKKDPFAAIYKQLAQSYSKFTPGKYTETAEANFYKGIKNAYSFYKNNEKMQKMVFSLALQGRQVAAFAKQNLDESFSTKVPAARFKMSASEISRGLAKAFPKVVDAKEELTTAVVESASKEIKEMAKKVATGGGGRRGKGPRTAVGGSPQDPLGFFSSDPLSDAYKRGPAARRRGFGWTPKMDAAAFRAAFNLDALSKAMEEEMVKGLKGTKFATATEQTVKQPLMKSVAEGILSGFQVLRGGVQSAAGNLFESIAAGARLVGPALLLGLSTALAAFGAMAKLALKPITFMLDTVKAGLKEAFTVGPEFTANLYRAASPISLVTGNFKGAIDSVRNSILQTLGTTMLLPVEATKTAIAFTRVNQSAAGLPEYLKAVSVLTKQTGENIDSINDAILGWSQAFNIDLSKGAAKIAQEVSTIVDLTGATMNEIKPIAMWLMPTFAAAAGDAAENFRMMLSLAGGLAQRGVVAPIMMRTIQGLMTLLETPPGKMLGLFAQTGINLFKGPGSKEFDSYMSTSGYKMKELLLKQRQLVQSYAGGAISQAQFTAENDSITKQLQEQDTLAESVHRTYLKMGLSAKEPKEQLKELLKLKKDEAALTEFIAMIPGSSKATFFQFLNEVERAIYNQGVLSKNSAKIAEQIGMNIKAASKMAQETFTATFNGFWDMLWTQLGEPIVAPLYTSLNKVWTGFSSVLTGGLMDKLGNTAAYIGEQLVGPLVEDFGTYVTKALSGQNTTAESFGIQRRLEALMKVVGGLWDIFFRPFANLFYQSFTHAWGILSTFLIKQLAWLGDIFGTAVAMAFGKILRASGVEGPVGQMMRTMGMGITNASKVRMSELMHPGIGTAPANVSLEAAFSSSTALKTASEYASQRIKEAGDVFVTKVTDTKSAVYGSEAWYNMIKGPGGGTASIIDSLQRNTDLVLIEDAVEKHMSGLNTFSTDVVSAFDETTGRLLSLAERIAKIKEKFAADSVSF